MRSCHNCGKIATDSDEFCIECGSPTIDGEDNFPFAHLVKGNKSDRYADFQILFVG